jgi:hypothetical protein
MAHTQHCKRTNCRNYADIDVDGRHPTQEQIDIALDAANWRDGLCPDCNGLGPRRKA